MTYAYEATFTYEPDDGCWYVDFPAFEGSCFTDGETIEEAATNAADVLSLAIADYLDNGRPLPAPTFSEPPLSVVCVSLDETFVERSKCLTYRQAAEELGVSASRVSQLVKAGRLDARTYDGRAYVTIESVNNRKANPPVPHRPPRLATA